MHNVRCWHVQDGRRLCVVAVCSMRRRDMVERRGDGLPRLRNRVVVERRGGGVRVGVRRWQLQCELVVPDVAVCSMRRRNMVERRGDDLPGVSTGPRFAERQFGDCQLREVCGRNIQPNTGRGRRLCRVRRELVLSGGRVCIRRLLDGEEHAGRGPHELRVSSRPVRRAMPRHRVGKPVWREL